MKRFYSEDYQWKVEVSAVLEKSDTFWTTVQVFKIQEIFKGTCLASKDEKSWGLLNSKLEIILPFEYIAEHHDEKEFRFSSKGYLSTRKNEAGSLFGAVNYKG